MRKSQGSARIAAGEQLHTRRPAWYGPPRCCETATCVPDRERCGPPDGRRSRSSAQGYESRSRGVRDSRADRRREGKKTFCCVTTRRCKLWIPVRLGRGLDARTARTFSLGMLGFDLGSLTVFGLSSRCLPATDLSPTLGILAVALIPGPRSILASTPFAQAGPLARPTRSG